MYSVYDCSEDDKYRYTLGDKKGKTLYVIGVNPSTATDLQLDPTLKNVKKFAEILGFDSFMMLNLYPQRSTYPDELHEIEDKQEVQRNIEFINSIVDKGSTVWAAWGETVEIRPYLLSIAKNIYDSLADKNLNWIQYDDLTKMGHPRHPLYKKHTDQFRPFEIDYYFRVKSKAA